MSNSCVIKIFTHLEKAYPDAKLVLRYTSPLELLVATILAAQCTDERVNKVTETLFKKYRTARDYATAEQAVFEQEIRSTGFYRNKAKNIIACNKTLEEKFQGEVPDKIEDLVTLPGVGRKTANVLLGSVFGKQAIAVDTHVFRVSHRLKLAQSKDPDNVELELEKSFPATNGRACVSYWAPMAGVRALRENHFARDVWWRNGVIRRIKSLTGRSLRPIKSLETTDCTDFGLGVTSE